MSENEELGTFSWIYMCLLCTNILLQSSNSISANLRMIILRSAKRVNANNISRFILPYFISRIHFVIFHFAYSDMEIKYADKCMFLPVDLTSILLCVE